MAELDTDAFTGYSNGNLATVSGGKWTALTGSGFLDLIVSSNTVIGAGTTDHFDVITSWSGGDDHYSEATLTTNATSSPSGVTARSDAVSSCYLLAVETNVMRIYKVPSFAVLLGPVAVTTAANDRWRLEATGSGTVTLKAFQNDVQRGSNATDASSPYNTGKPGLFCNKNVCAPLDLWAAGNFAAAGEALSLSLGEPVIFSSAF